MPSKATPMRKHQRSSSGSAKRRLVTQEFRRRLWTEKLEPRHLMATFAGTLESDLLWDPGTPIDPNRTTYFRATEFETYTLDVSQLREQLADAPLEFTEEASSSDVVVTLPRPDGTLERFTVFASPIMEAGLAAQFPEIQTFAGQGVDDPAAKLRFDLTPAGFHAQVLSPEGSYYIDPYYHLDSSLYASYFATGSFRVPEAGVLAEQYRGTQSMY